MTAMHELQYYLASIIHLVSTGRSGRLKLDFSIYYLILPFTKGKEGYATDVLMKWILIFFLFLDMY